MAAKHARPRLHGGVAVGLMPPNSSRGLQLLRGSRGRGRQPERVVMVTYFLSTTIR